MFKNSLIFVLGLLLVTTSARAVDIHWLDKSTNEDGFNIEIKIDEGDWLPLATVDKRRTRYHDASSTTIGRRYCYRVNAYNSSAASMWSTPGCFTRIDSTPSGPIASPTDDDRAMGTPNSVTVTP